MGAVLRWLTDYANFLEEGTELLLQGQAPSLEWLDRSQDFDDARRGFDVDLLRMVLQSPESGPMLEHLDRVRSRFEGAFTGVRDGLRDRISATRNSRHALDGYREAGDRQRGGPKFLTANL